ncbi:MAG: protein BatD [Oligoflexia bacterium]|nr:protein BatD [Oligoflexia bacterium]
MAKIGNIFFTFILAFSLNALGDIRIDATVDQTEVTTEDIITLSITVSSDTDVSDTSPLLPDLNGFEIMGSFNQQQMSSVFQNGKFQTHRKIIYKYKLNPQQTGELTIGKAKLEVNGQVLETKPIKIKVLAAGSGPKNQQSPQSQQKRGYSQPQQQDDDKSGFPPGFPGFDDEDDLFNQLLRRRGFTLDNKGGVKSNPQPDRNAFYITVEANKKRAYVGEQVIAKWTLYTKGAIQSFDALKYPELKGFWKEDLEIAQKLNFEQEIINGVTYNKAVLVSYALFPISAGKKTIDQFRAKATVIDTASSGLGVFGIGRPMTFVKASEELPIDVVALPTQGRPSSFSGAVGKFNISAALSSQAAKVNQPLSLKIKFSGRGNVKAIELPPLNLPNSLEVYDTKKEAIYNKTGDGSMEFEVLIIPRNAGDVSIPSISLSYFDPQTAKYVTQSTPEFKLKVLPGDGNASSAASGLQLDPALQVATAKDVRPVKTTADFILPPNIAKTIWVLMFLIPTLWFTYRVRKILNKDKLNLRQLIRKKSKQKIKEAKKKLSLGDHRSCGVELNNAILMVLGEIAKTGAGAKTVEEILNYLPQISNEQKEKINQFIQKCHTMSFAPKELISKIDQKIISEAEDLVEDLLKYLNTTDVKS